MAQLVCGNLFCQTNYTGKMSHCKCRLVVYCSKECQKINWTIHKTQCLAIKTICNNDNKAAKDMAENDNKAAEKYMAENDNKAEKYMAANDNKAEKDIAQNEENHIKMIVKRNEDTFLTNELTELFQPMIIKQIPVVEPMNQYTTDINYTAEKDAKTKESKKDTTEKEAENNIKMRAKLNEPYYNPISLTILFVMIYIFSK